MERGTGSGVIIDSDGLIVTNHHVIENSDEIIVTLDEGESVKAEIIGKDAETDLAVLEIDPTDLEKEKLPSAEFGDSKDLVVGELAIAIGNPLGLAFQQSVTSGVISATDRTVRVGDDYIRLVQTDAAINPGNSGGPLVNALGEVVGINSIKIGESGIEGMGFAIPSNLVIEIVDELVEKGYVERPWIGIAIQEIDKYVAEIFDLPVDYGVYIQEVEPNSPAGNAGIQSGDILTEIDNRKIENLPKLRSIRNDFEVGDQVEATIIRNEEEKTVEMTLESNPYQDIN
ncbi:peptidase S1 [Natranaerobius trueperi]|uniref:Peptidase S1 n=2 Tax=Natranaerobius trueperi TaxID=759412 RepID=A0A226BWU8_9FIRM|nr:peptidase S1 [Natranaerobius trueperi]